MLQRLAQLPFEIASAHLELLYQCRLNSLDEATRTLAFDPVERSLRPVIRLLAPLLDKVTSSHWLRPLRTYRKRPRRRAAEQRDEPAPSLGDQAGKCALAKTFPRHAGTVKVRAHQ